MPPFLAFCLCAGLVIWLLVIDHQQSQELSLATWIPSAWLLICASRPLAWWVTGQNVDGDISALDGSALDRNVLLLLIFGGVITLVLRSFDWVNFFSSHVALFILFAFMLISIIWSEFPFVSFKRWFKTLGSVLMAMVILSEVSPSKALMAILRRVVFILIPFSMMLIKYYPELGVQFGRWSGHTMWAGVTMGKNGLGPLCVISAFYVVWSIVQKYERKDLPRVPYQTTAEFLILGITLILMRGPGGAFSATSIIILVLGLTVYFSLRKLSVNSSRVGYAIMFSVGGVALFFSLANLILDTSLLRIIASIFGRDATLTGRTDLIWSKLVPIAMEHPILGVGYGAFWIKSIDFDFTMPINQAHNGYLDVFMELGIVGLVLLCICLLSYFVKARLSFDIDRDWASLQMAFLAMVIVHNWTETSFLRSTILMWNLFLLFWLIGPSMSPKVLLRIFFHHDESSDKATKPMKVQTC